MILPEGMVAFQNNYDKYLSVDEVAGGTLQLRGDSETMGFAERFHVKVQNEYKRKGTATRLHLFICDVIVRRVGVTTPRYAHVR